METIRGLQVQMLGKPRLELDGQPLTRLMAVKHQALVFYLAAHEHPVQRSRLAALLWSRLAPTAARGNLRVALSRLRRQLPGLLEIDAEEVGLAAAEVRVDWRELERIAARPEASPDETSVAVARTWRGPLLDGFELGDADEYEQWLASSRQRAARSAITLRGRLARVCESAGRPEEAIEHLRGWLDIDDADEQAHIDLMRLLAATGRRTAAIAQYEVCRATLMERLGARPSADCYALYCRIHADAPRPVVIAAGPVPAPTPAPVPVLAPAPPSVDATIPHTEGILVGRQAELALLAERLLDPSCRWLSIVGPGGVGKTRLAAAAATYLAEHFNGGLTWFSAREVAGGRGAAAEPGADDIAGELMHRVQAGPGSAPALLILDNLETLADGRGLVENLLATLPRITVLGTSRVRIGSSREWLLELGGLDLASDAAGEPGSSEAVGLFVASMQRLDPTFDPRQHGAAIERICRRVAGLPLAIELAAQGARTVGTETIAARMDTDLALSDPDRAAGDPHRSLDVVLADSWSALPATVRAAACRLAALPDEFDADLAALVQVPFTALEVLGRHSWLARGARSRLAMHPLQRAYLRRLPEEPGPARDVTAAETVSGTAPTTLAVTRSVATLVTAALRAQLPTVGVFGDLAEQVDEPATATPCGTPHPIPADESSPALFDPPVVAMALDHAITCWPSPALCALVDDTAAWLLARDRSPEAAGLLARAGLRADLPGWRRIGWRLRQAEVLNESGKAVAAAHLWRRSLEALGFGDIEAHAPLPLPHGALRRVADLAPWPANDPERHAFSVLVARGLMAYGQHLSFTARPGPMSACTTLLWLLGARTLTPAERCSADAVAAYGSMLVGLPGLSRIAERRYQRRLAGHPRDQRLRLAAEEAVAARRVADGRWEGLTSRLDAMVEEWRRAHCPRHEIETRSLAAKLAFYQGMLLQSRRRFAELTARARLLEVDVGRFWGPLGEVEAGLTLETDEIEALQYRLDEIRHVMAEVENFDSAYTLRWFGLRARVAWRRGDLEALHEAVTAGAAACRRIRFGGFWAHEGFAGIGEGLLRLRRHERQTGGAVAPLQAGWLAFRRPLRAHCRRFTPARILWHYLEGLDAAEMGRRAEAGRSLRTAVRLAEHQGMRVELARSCVAVGALENDEQWSARALRLRREMGVIGATLEQEQLFR